MKLRRLAKVWVEFDFKGDITPDMSMDEALGVVIDNSTGNVSVDTAYLDFDIQCGQVTAIIDENGDSILNRIETPHVMITIQNGYITKVKSYESFEAAQLAIDHKISATTNLHWEIDGRRATNGDGGLEYEIHEVLI